VAVLLLTTGLIVLPQYLRVHRSTREMQHAERMRSLEQGRDLPLPDYPSLLAGRTAFLGPIVLISVAGTVTCFLIAFRSESVFTVALLVWVVSGVVSLASVTGGLALLGRLAQLSSGTEDEESSANSVEG
jgi:hypothetical protein